MESTCARASFLIELHASASACNFIKRDSGTVHTKSGKEQWRAVTSSNHEKSK